MGKLCKLIDIWNIIILFSINRVINHFAFGFGIAKNAIYCYNENKNNINLTEKTLLFWNLQVIHNRRFNPRATHTSIYSRPLQGPTDESPIKTLNKCLRIQYYFYGKNLILHIKTIYSKHRYKLASYPCIRTPPNTILPLLGGPTHTQHYY